MSSNQIRTGAEANDLESAEQSHDGLRIVEDLWSRDSTGEGSDLSRDAAEVRNVRMTVADLTRDIREVLRDGGFGFSGELFEGLTMSVETFLDRAPLTRREERILQIGRTNFSELSRMLDCLNVLELKELLDSLHHYLNDCSDPEIAGGVKDGLREALLSIAQRVEQKLEEYEDDPYFSQIRRYRRSARNRIRFVLRNEQGYKNLFAGWEGDLSVEELQKYWDQLPKVSREFLLQMLRDEIRMISDGLGTGEKDWEGLETFFREKLATHFESHDGMGQVHLPNLRELFEFLRRIFSEYRYSGPNILTLVDQIGKGAKEKQKGIDLALGNFEEIGPRRQGWGSGRWERKFTDLLKQIGEQQQLVSTEIIEELKAASHGPVEEWDAFVCEKLRFAEDYWKMVEDLCLNYLAPAKNIYNEMPQLAKVTILKEALLGFETDFE